MSTEPNIPTANLPDGKTNSLPVKNDALTGQDSPDIIPLSDALSEPDSETNTKRAFVSKGEKIHKWATYLSVDWVLNAAAGVTFAYWGKYNETGKRFWSQRISSFFTKALAPMIKDEASLKASAEYGNTFMSIIVGGMFTIPPLMILESKKIKKSIIKSFDTLIYGKDTVENDPKFAKAYDEIGNEPKKDFWAGLWSRLTSLAPLLAIVLIKPTRKLIDKYYFDHIEHGTDFLARKAGITPEKMFKGVSSADAQDRWKSIHKSAAMDLGFGIPYAGLHAFFYNMFAAKKDKAKRAEENAALPVKVEENSTTQETLPVQDVPAKQWSENFTSYTSQKQAVAGRQAMGGQSMVART